MIAALFAAAALAGAPQEIDGLAWMAGTWREAKDGVSTTEAWAPPAQGIMAGVTTIERPGKPVSREPMRISAEPAGLTFTAMPPGQPPTPFVLIPGKPGEAVFENKVHDFPQRVIYRRCGADLCARIEGTLGGKLQSQDWRYVRVK